MHGRPRQAPSAASPEELAKIEQYNKHKTTALAAYKNRIFSPTTLALTAAILAINPDLNTLFNFRKEQVMDLLLKNYFDKNNDFGEIQRIFQTELTLATTALRKNPKSYHAWYHRIWCLEHGLAAIDLGKEFALTEQYLSQDSRNFHCWNYRRYIARIAMGLPSAYEESNKSPGEILHEREVVERLCTQQNRDTPLSALPTITPPPDHPAKHTTTVEKELLFTQSMIEQDFSNFSAWYYRSILLPIVLMRRIISLPWSKTTHGGSFDQFYGLSLDKIKQFDLPLPSTTFTTTTTTTQLTTQQCAEFITHTTSLITTYLSFDLYYINIALSMSPQDQSPWFYQRWLLSFIQSLLHTHPLDKHHYFHPTPRLALGANSFEHNTQTPAMWNADEYENLLQSFPIMSYIPQSEYNITHYTELLGIHQSNIMDGVVNQQYNLFSADLLEHILTTFAKAPQTHNIYQKQRDTVNIIAHMSHKKTIYSFTTFLDVLNKVLCDNMEKDMNNNNNVNNNTTTLFHQLRIVQYQLVAKQFKYYTQDLLGLILDNNDEAEEEEENNKIATNPNQQQFLSTQQFQESRLTLLSIVVLTLSVYYLHNIHRQYDLLDQYHLTALKTTPQKKNAQRVDPEVEDDATTTTTIAAQTQFEKLYDITHNTAYVAAEKEVLSFLKLQLPQMGNAETILQYLSNQDANRRDYYGELQQFYAQADMFHTALVDAEKVNKRAQKHNLGVGADVLGYDGVDDDSSDGDYMDQY